MMNMAFEIKIQHSPLPREEFEPPQGATKYCLHAHKLKTVDRDKNLAKYHSNTGATLSTKYFTNYCQLLKQNNSRTTQTATNSDLEATAVPPTTSLLKLPALGAHIWLGVAVRHTRSLAKVPHCLTGILGSPQEDLQMHTFANRNQSLNNPMQNIEVKTQYHHNLKYT
jgi:hypothetical protein